MADQKSAEEAAHEQSRAVVDGDLGKSIRGMTPDALARSMEIGNTSWDLTSYELSAQGKDGDDYIFDVTYETDEGTLSLREWFRYIDGAWKMVDIEHRT